MAKRETFEEFCNRIAREQSDVYFAYTPVETRMGDPLFRGLVMGAMRKAREELKTPAPRVPKRAKRKETKR